MCTDKRITRVPAVSVAGRGLELLLGRLSLPELAASLGLGVELGAEEQRECVSQSQVSMMITAASEPQVLL